MNKTSRLLTFAIVAAMCATLWALIAGCLCGSMAIALLTFLVTGIIIFGVLTVFCGR